MPTWWNSLSPNEKAAFIAYPGVLLSSAVAIIVAVYNKRSSKKTPPPASALSSPSLGPKQISREEYYEKNPPQRQFDPTVDPLSSIEAYFLKVDSLKHRLGPQKDFIKDTRGSRVTWQGVVHNWDCDNLPAVATVSFYSKAFLQPDTWTNANFRRPSASLLERIKYLNPEDVIRVSGNLAEGIFLQMEASDITFLHPAEVNVQTLPGISLQSAQQSSNTLQAEEIFETLREAFSRNGDYYTGQYTGLFVRWNLPFYSCRVVGDESLVMLTAGSAAHHVHCRLRSSEHPFLTKTQRGEVLRVEGVIDAVNTSSLYLEEAVLERP